MTSMDLNRFVQLKGSKQNVTINSLNSANGRTAFRCTLWIDGFDHQAHGVASDKKSAQQKAVEDMIGFLRAIGEFEETLATPTAGSGTKKRKTAGGGSIVTAAAPAAPLAHAAPASQAYLAPAAKASASPAAPAAPQAKQPVIEDGMGCFTLEVARSQMNQTLQRWRQKTDIALTPENGGFRASIIFFSSRRNQWFNESHWASQKKQAQNELALQVCRKLFQLDLMPKYSRSIHKAGSFSDTLHQSKYYDSGSFSVGLPAPTKARLRGYLTKVGYELPEPGAEMPPGTVLLESTAPPQERTAPPSVQAIPWAPPGATNRPPWPSKGPRGQAPPAAQPPNHLPVAGYRGEIVSAVAGNQVCVIKGSTGSGKTTQVPQYILDSQDGSMKSIIVCQPRRLPAITVAQRVAAERGEPLGDSVGYAVRFDSVWPRPQNSICYMTSGMLLKRLHNRGLVGISHVVVDEVHERDLNNDLLLALLRMAVQAHSGLKVILMSATIDVVKFREYMASVCRNGTVPVLDVQGRVFDVETYYLEDTIEALSWQPGPKWKEKGAGKDGMNQCDANAYSPSTVQTLGALQESQVPLELVVSIVRKVVTERQGGDDFGAILIFLPTWSLMSLCRKFLEAEPDISRLSKYIMLHSHVPKDEQMDAFRPAPAGITKVIIATNIAESSITIDDVSVVIDSGRVKLTFCSETTGLSHNQVVWTGRMNMDQRKGRAGRTRAGTCFRLCSRRRYEEGLENEVPPELTRTPLVDAALLLKSLGLGDVEVLLSQCLDPPAKESVDHAIAELCSIHALDSDLQLTHLGQILAQLPIDPHIGLALLLGHWLFGLGEAMATICAAMSFDEPFPFDKTAGYLPWSIQEKYKGSHKNSDQFVLGMVHQDYARIHAQEGEAAAGRFCQKEQLNWSIMRQVHSASEQLRSVLSNASLGSLAAGEGDSLEEGDGEGPGGKRNHFALADWGPQDWQWAAIQLLLAMALPQLGVHSEKRHIWVSDDTIGGIHKGSVNCNKGGYVFPSPLFAFLEQTKEGGWKPPRCRQSTNVPPAMALLRPFANGSVAISDDGAQVIVAGWVPLGPADMESTCLLLFLRRKLEDFLVGHAAEVASAKAEGASHMEMSPQDQELVALLRGLLPGCRRAVMGAAAGSSAGAAKGAAKGAAASGQQWRPPAGGLRPPAARPPAGGLRPQWSAPADPQWGAPAGKGGASWPAKGGGGQWGGGGGGGQLGGGGGQWGAAKGQWGPAKGSWGKGKW